jgi:DNA polymerase-1
MSKFKLSNTIGVSVDEAQAIIDKFFESVPKVKQLLDSLDTLGKTRGYIKSDPYYKRIRQYPKWHALEDKDWSEKQKILGEIGRASMNFPFQSSNANLVKQALINIQQEIDTNNWPVRILLQVHDEIVTECHEDYAEAWCIKLEELMIEAAQIIIKSIPVVVDCKIATHWSK